MTLSKQYKKLIRRMAQSRFPGEEADIEAKADQQYSEFWKTTPDIGGKDNMQFKDLDFLIAFFSFYEGNEHVPVWNHYITMVPLDGSHTKYTDRVEIRAGWKTPLIWLWANAFYTHRQRKWIHLLKED